MDITQDRKSEIVLDLLKELMSEMKGSAGSKFKPKEEEKAEEEEVPAAVVEIEVGPDEDDEEDTDIEEYDGADLEDVLDKASEEEPKSAASRRLSKLAASNKR